MTRIKNMVLNRTVLKILFIVNFYVFIFVMVRYGFSSPEKRVNHNDVSTYYGTIADLKTGVEFAIENAVKEFVLPSGTRVTLTIDPELQNTVNQIFIRYNLPVAAFVAIEPATGKILAISGYSADSGIKIDSSFMASYPAASLIKIVTASAALEDLSFSPRTKISYRSGLYDVSRLDFTTPESKRYPAMTLTEAIAKSANNVFGKLTAKYIGRDRFIKYLDNFYFFKTIPFEQPVEQSMAHIPESELGLARAGAGFGKIMVSPLHAAMIGASIANNGEMMKPYIIESIQDKRENLLYMAREHLLVKTVKPETAEMLVKMMEKTPVFGTLRRAFSKKKWRYFVKKFDVAGKTGSITWGPPKLRYEWSLGMAPAGNPSICFVSLTGNTDLWFIKSTYIAREALAEFFDYDYRKMIRKNKKRRKKRG